MFSLTTSLLRPVQRRASPALSRLLSSSSPVCAGHNKWSKIKDKKASNDSQKSTLYARMNHEIVVASKRGGSADPTKNVLLANVLKKAKDQGVPKENIAKSLARCQKGDDKSGERLTYEAVACGSYGIIIECITNNTNRTIHSVREILTKHGARMAPVNFMFNHVGRITVALDDPEKFLELMELGMENGAIDIVEASKLDESDAQSHWLYCKPSDLKSLEDAIMKQEGALGVKVETSEIAYVPIPAPGSEAESAESESDEVSEEREKVQALLQDLDDLDDTLRVWSTLDPGANL